ncbi:hypothetical protein V6N12_031056 [Hibiscus sabdariffa]|uniref:Uncharacterized protein n=1 Tax=Hibiscus sabdariffa TaxID=183260 RepID=A0ABR2E7T3_9ROSI
MGTPCSKFIIEDDEANCDNRSEPDAMEDGNSSDSDSHFSAVEMETSQVNLGYGKIDNLNVNVGNGDSVEAVVSVNDGAKNQESV